MTTQKKLWGVYDACPLCKRPPADAAMLEALTAIEAHELDGTYTAEMMLESARAMARAAIAKATP